ncbi:MAG TPA: hypothetical protein VJZ00_25520, partial [Thermoanaerobaculia bacterium]|nr:hypothetical protein [Thermoanaerobaculia bacterium]
MSLGARVTRTLGSLAVHAPALAFRATDMIAAVAWPRVSAADVQRLFPALTERDAKRAAAHARNSEMRNHVVLEMMLAGGMDPCRALVAHEPRVEAIASPAVLGTFHVGALAALGPALERVPGRVLVIRRAAPVTSVRSRLELEIIDDDEQRRAFGFARALEWLASGRSVFLPLDPEQAVRVAVPFCARTLQLARGPF